MDARTPGTSFRQTSVARVATGFRRHVCLWRSRFHHRTMGVQSRHQRREAVRLRSLRHTLEKTNGRLVEVCPRSRHQSSDVWWSTNDLATSRTEGTARVPRVDVAIARRNLVNWDRDYLLVSKKHDLASAFTYYASPDVRLYRDGSLPFIGRNASINALAKSCFLLTSK